MKFGSLVFGNVGKSLVAVHVRGGNMYEGGEVRTALSNFEERKRTVDVQINSFTKIELHLKGRSGCNGYC